MEPAGLSIGLVGLAGQLTKASMECYNIFSQMSETGSDHDSALHDLRTEAFRLRQWENAWNLGNTSLPGRLDARDDRYRYALAGLARIVATFAKIAELQTQYTSQKNSGKAPKRVKRNTVANLVPYRNTRGRAQSKSPGPNTCPTTSALALQLNSLSLLENPKILSHTEILPGLSEEIQLLTQATETLQQSLSTYRKLRWVIVDREKLKELIGRTKNYIDGLYQVLPPFFPSHPVFSTASLRQEKLKICFEVPLRLTNIQKDSYFVYRENLLKLLIHEMGEGRATSVGGVNQVVLYGPGGIGKTQLALDYIHRQGQNYHSVFWLNASSKQALRLSFAHILEQIIECHAQQCDVPDYVQIGKLLGMAGKLDSTGRFSREKEEDELFVIEAVQRWLGAKGNTEWLLVLDNLDDLESFSLTSFLPPLCQGTIIITSRRLDCVIGRRGIEVQQMQDDEAEKLLLQSSHCKWDSIPSSELETERHAVATILQKLGCLPLALDQAGAYIHMQQCSFSGYLKSLERNVNSLLNRGWKPEMREQSVFATWNLSFEALKKGDPKAAELFLLCGFLDNHSIPEELLRTGMGLQNEDTMLDDSIRSLFSYSLAKRKQRGLSFTIHPLVHLWIQNFLKNMPLDQRAKILRDTSKIIATAVCSFHNDELLKGQDRWNLERHTIPHVLALARGIQAFKMDAEEILDEIDALGFICAKHGNHTVAQQWAEWALAGAEKLYGADHEKTLKALYNLAMAFSLHKKYDIAIEWFQRALLGAEKNLCADHSLSLDITAGLAFAHLKQKKYDTALEGFQRVLAKKEEDLATMERIALLYGERGQTETALEWFRQILAKREKIYGADHVKTFTIIHNIATGLGIQGEIEEAMAWYQRALTGQERLLGFEHPDTLTTACSMAFAFKQQSKYDKAVEMYQRVYTTREKMVGATDPSTLSVMHKIGQIYEVQEEYDNALEWYQRALRGQETVLGFEHPDTLTTACSIASIFHEQNEYDKALEMYQRVLAAREKTVGATDPSTLSVMHEIGRQYDGQNKYDKALQWYLRFLETREGSGSNYDPETCFVLNSIAHIYVMQENFFMAREWYQRCLEVTENVHGVDHLNYFTTMQDLAITLYQQDEIDSAIQLFMKGIEGHQRLLGNEHPSTQSSIQSLVNMCAKAGRLQYVSEDGDEGKNEDEDENEGDGKNEGGLNMDVDELQS